MKFCRAVQSVSVKSMNIATNPGAADFRRGSKAAIRSSILSR